MKQSQAPFRSRGITSNGRCAIRVLTACILAFFLLTHLATGARAACTNPDRAIGKIVYSADSNLFQGCTARGWLALHHSVTASSGGGPLTQVGTVTSSDLGWAHGVVVSGSYAYVASALSDSLTVIDVSDPANPVQVGTITNAQLAGTHDVALSGNYAYLASFTSDRLNVIDVSNPVAPVQIGTVTGPDLDGARAVAVSGNYAYVAGALADSLTVIDISDPFAAMQVGTVSTPDLNNARGVAVSGNYAYVAAFNSDSLTVVDISNPLAPVQVGTVTSSALQGARSVAVAGNYAYVASSASASLTVIDVSDPAAPAQVGVIEFDNARAVAVSGPYAYVADYSGDSLTAIDVSDPANPVQVGEITSPDLNGAHGVAVSDNTAYVTGWIANSLTVIDLGSGGDCTGPDRPSGRIVFNADHDVFQGCAGGRWVVLHGTGTPGGATDCTAPAKPVGALLFNEDYDVFQGCTTRGWKAFHAPAAPPPVLCTNIGDVCGDGSIFAGDTNMYVTDVTQITSVQWSLSPFDTGADSQTDGAANQAWIVANETLATYPAFEPCENLNRHGHTDWYLPARNELDHLYTHRNAIGAFTTGLYWSSTENSHNDAWSQRFSDGYETYVIKNIPGDVRCVRRGDATPDAFGFTDQTGMATSTLIESDIIEITGMDDGTAVSITGDGSPEYRICADATCSAVNHGWSSGSGSIDAGEYLQLRLTSHEAGGTMHSATVTVGTESDQWDVTTDSGGPTGCPNIGDVCADGSVHAGLSPDGNVAMYTTPANAGSYTWNKGSTNWINTAMVNCINGTP
ncbi:MAG: DUF1566 domain-containing protein, partial [Cytophagales bacterium]|nr:DUF1566 domain-containing protein [Cytophagales bacterium]